MKLVVALFIALSLFAPGRALLTLIPAWRRLTRSNLESFSAAVILSLAILITPLIVFDWTMQVPIFKWTLCGHATCTVLASIFLALRLLIHRDQTLEAVRCYVIHHSWTMLLIFGAAMLWLGLLYVRPVLFDWDGANQYLRDGLLYSHIHRLPAFVPEPYAQPGLQYIYNPPLQPILYAYGIHVQKSLGVNLDFKLLSTYNLVMLAGMVTLLLAFIKRFSMSLTLLPLTILIWATYPTTLEIVQSAFLSVDIPYAFLSLAAVFFAVRTFKHSRGRWFFWILTALAAGLSFAAKVQGPLTLLLIGLVVSYYILPRLLRLVLVSCTIFALLFLFVYLTTDLANLVLSWHFALAILVVGAIFGLFYAAPRLPTAPLPWRTLVSMGATFVLLYSLNAVFMARTYHVTGSLGGWYTSSLIRQYTPNYEWAKSIDVAQKASRVWRAGGGERPGLPELRSLTPFIGYEWNPTLLPFALLGAITAFRSQRMEIARLLIALGAATVLAWWLVFGMDLTRQLFIISFPYAILHVLGLSQFLSWVSNRVTTGMAIAYAAFILVWSSPFWLPFQQFYSFNLLANPLTLTGWKGGSNWNYYTSENLRQVLRYVFAVDAVCLTLLSFRGWVHSALGKVGWQHVWSAGLGVMALLVFCTVAALPIMHVVSTYTVAGFDAAYTDEMYHGFVPAVRSVEASLAQAEPGVVMTFWSFALTTLTDYRLIMWDLADPIRNGYYRELLVTRDMSRVLELLREQRVIAAIVPTGKDNIRYDLYRNLVDQEVDLPVLWLLEDSNAFPSCRVGDWKIVDLSDVPEAFTGLVTVLVDTERGRSSWYQPTESLAKAATIMRLTPVIDVSGLLEKNPSLNREKLVVTTHLRLKKLEYDDATGWSAGTWVIVTLQNNGVFVMPSVELGDLVTGITEEPGDETGYDGIQIDAISFSVSDAAGNIIFRSKTLDTSQRENSLFTCLDIGDAGQRDRDTAVAGEGSLPGEKILIYDRHTKQWSLSSDMISRSVSQEGYNDFSGK